MSAAAGARPDVAGSLAFPRVRAAACWPHSLHGTGRCLEGSRVGGGVSLSTIWASKTNKLQMLLHQEVAMVPVDTWKCRNRHSLQKAASYSQKWGENQGWCCLIFCLLIY